MTQSPSRIRYRRYGRPKRRRPMALVVDLAKIIGDEAELWKEEVSISLVYKQLLRTDVLESDFQRGASSGPRETRERSCGRRGTNGLCQTLSQTILELDISLLPPAHRRQI